MHFKDIKIVNSFFITNRGRALLTNLLFDEHAVKFNHGDTFRYEDKIYEIKSIEALLKFENGKAVDYVAFLAKEITPKEMFVKTFKPEYDSSTMRDVKRRIKYRWFIRRKQAIVLFFLSLKDKIENFFKKKK